MKVEFAINAGLPCYIPTRGQAKSKKDAIQSFKDYIADCDRWGNPYKDAFLEIESDKNGLELFEVGPRGGIVKVEY